MVRFATTCDECQKRSKEFTAWPTCRECWRNICPTCRWPGSLEENEGVDTVLCKDCAMVDA